MTDLENKLEAKEEELKSNEIELVGWTEKYKQVQAQVGLLKEELAGFMLITDYCKLS